MSAEKEVVSTSQAPQNDAPYSQAIVSGGFVFVAGQGSADPKTMNQIDGGIGVQTERTIRNIVGILNEASGKLDDVVKTLRSLVIVFRSAPCGLLQRSTLLGVVSAQRSLTTMHSTSGFKSNRYGITFAPN